MNTFWLLNVHSTMALFGGSCKYNETRQYYQFTIELPSMWHCLVTVLVCRTERIVVFLWMMTALETVVCREGHKECRCFYRVCFMKMLNLLSHTYNLKLLSSLEIIITFTLGSSLFHHSPQNSVIWSFSLCFDPNDRPGMLLQNVCGTMKVILRSKLSWNVDCIWNVWTTFGTGNALGF